MRVLNRKHDGCPPGAKYIGRPSKWGNPYSVENYGRERAIELYKEWVNIEITKSRLDLSELFGWDLVCWCAPLPCHGDVLISLIKEWYEYAKNVLIETGYTEEDIEKSKMMKKNG